MCGFCRGSATNLEFEQDVANFIPAEITGGGVGDAFLVGGLYQFVDILAPDQFALAGNTDFLVEAPDPIDQLPGQCRIAF